MDEPILNNNQEQLTPVKTLPAPLKKIGKKLPKLSEKDNIKDKFNQLITLELQKCIKDPIYFITKYVKIQHQEKGIIPFTMFPFQVDTLKKIHENNRTIILKSRQMGISTLISAYTLWTMIFNEGKNILIISTRQQAATEIISKIKVAHENLPTWLKPEIENNNALSLKFKNNSKVLATSSASDSSRGFSASQIILDECAFIDSVDAIWTSAQPTLASIKDGKAILLSTPNGIGNFFYKTWADSETKNNDFVNIRLPWHLHPERNQAWRDQQTKDLGQKMASQECDCSYISSGNSLIDLILLEEYEKESVKDPIETRYNNGLWIFQPPDYSKSYILSADTARGDGKDFSAAHVIDVETTEQVAEYKYQIGTTEFGDILVNLAIEYNNALLIIERENIGWATIQRVIDRNYDNLFYCSTSLKYVDIKVQLKNRYYDEEMKPGFSTNEGTRPLLISKLERYFREKVIKIRSIRTISELKTFVWNKGKAQALEGYNDDLVLSLGMGLWVRDTALKLRQEGIDLSKAILNSVKLPQAEPQSLYISKNQPRAVEQWSMKTGRTAGNDQREDLTWLLR